MIKNNINQFEIKGIVKLAPATNHLIQSISHNETGDLIFYTNRIFLSEDKFTNSFVDFVNNHLVREERRLLIITPSQDGCRKLKQIVEENGFDCISVYLTKIITTNYVIEKNNVLFGVENLLEHSNTNSPSITIKDIECRRVFVNYSSELINGSNGIVTHDFDKSLLM